MLQGREGEKVSPTQELLGEQGVAGDLRGWLGG